MTPPISGPPMVPTAMHGAEVAAVAAALARRDHRRHDHLDQRVRPPTPMPWNTRQAMSCPVVWDEAGQHRAQHEDRPGRAGPGSSC